MASMVSVSSDYDAASSYPQPMDSEFVTSTQHHDHNEVIFQRENTTATADHNCHFVDSHELLGVIFNQSSPNEACQQILLTSLGTIYQTVIQWRPNLMALPKCTSSNAIISTLAYFYSTVARGI
ncbi:hypothetical protein GJ496_011946 [Pomphorhynchus laevis]|nr:hypothetical protein GJ496_011946 [Pomphorhynchus laevis]